MKDFGKQSYTSTAKSYCDKTLTFDEKFRRSVLFRVWLLYNHSFTDRKIGEENQSYLEIIGETLPLARKDKSEGQFPMRLSASTLTRESRMSEKYRGELLLGYLFSHFHITSRSVGRGGLLCLLTLPVPVRGERHENKKRGDKLLRRSF